MKKANLADAVWLRPIGVFGEFDVKFMPNFRSVNLTNSWAKFDEKIKIFFTKVVKFARLNLTNDFVKFGSNLTDRQTAGRILAKFINPKNKPQAGLNAHISDKIYASFFINPPRDLTKFDPNLTNTQACAHISPRFDTPNFKSNLQIKKRFSSLNFSSNLTNSALYRFNETLAEFNQMPKYQEPRARAIAEKTTTNANKSLSKKAIRTPQMSKILDDEIFLIIRFLAAKFPVGRNFTAKISAERFSTNEVSIVKFLSSEFLAVAISAAKFFAQTRSASLRNQSEIQKERTNK